jgi:hypothetical protein
MGAANQRGAKSQGGGIETNRRVPPIRLSSARCRLVHDCFTFPTAGARLSACFWDAPLLRIAAPPLLVSE